MAISTSRLQREAVLRLYEAFRAKNPWLPEAEHVTLEALTVNLDPQAFSTLGLVVQIELPDEWTKPVRADE